ncbi:feather keratin 1-like [Strix uralensis]|uniref:feather keratin 1-like n=2 Tax=Strix uralensis TaxID=36305 RepID=UPI003DA73971
MLEQYISRPFPSLSHPLLLPPSPWEQGFLSTYLPPCLHWSMGLPSTREGKGMKSLWFESLMVLPHRQVMSCYNPCVPCLPCLPCQPCGPTPLANSCNEPCVRQCQDSTVVIQPSPVVVTLPGPILSSFPQSTAVGSSTSAAVGSILSSEGVPINSGGFGLSGFGSRLCGRRCLPC